MSDDPDYLAGVRDMTAAIRKHGINSQTVLDMKNEAARIALRDLIKNDGQRRGTPYDRQVEEQILTMVDEGLITANADGTITLTGTREQLLAHGLDPDKMYEMDVDPKVDESLDAHFVSCFDPLDKNRILCFPTSVWEQVIAAGEKGYVPLTAAEVRKIQRDNPDGTVTVSMVMKYEKDKPFEVSTKEDLEQNLREVDEEIATLDDQLARNKRDVEALEWLKTEYGVLLGSLPGQQFVGVNIIGLRDRDKRPSTRLVTKTFGEPRPVDPTMPTRVVMDPPVGRGVVMPDGFQRQWGPLQ